jgi:hypothetical protein
MGFESSRILLSRSVSEIRRIEDSVHAFLDTILLFDSTMFHKDNVGRKRIFQIIRKILSVGSYGVGPVMKHWKEFCSFLYNRVAQFETELPLPSPENFFWRGLSYHPDIVAMLTGDTSKVLAEKFAHLTSTRHFASGDKKAEEESLKKFFRTIEDPYKVDPSWLNTISLIAERVGEKCKRLPGKLGISPHVSLSAAGSYYQTVKNGGRGAEIREALEKTLCVSPNDDEVIEIPWATLRCPKGRPRWRFWCRDTEYTHYPDVDFAEVILEERFKEEHPYYQGFDESIGNQILAVAFLEWEDWKRTGLGIPCRVLTVPEPGYKARIVTTGPYWLNILQQSVSHSLKAFLGRHPSCRSSLTRTDQAWQALYLLQNKTFPEGSACLSSDLAEATDCIPKVIGSTILSGFIRGVGLRSRHIETCLDLLNTSRCFTSEHGVSEFQTRGIMMGEPLTKAILTILNLVVEEYALRTYKGIPLTQSFYKEEGWRSYHIGGDDHLAVGPRQYLGLITDCHLRCGSRISIGKHGISAKLVKYCEKVLTVPEILRGFSASSINESTSGYEASPFVDSVKVRLLSPLSKAFEVSAERNIAIGKGLSLGRTLKWMNPDHFDSKWLRMVRDRFFQRMGSLLPDRSSGVYWQLMLPVQWGGLDLYLPGETRKLYDKLPTLTLSVMEDVDMDEPRGHENVRLLRKLLSNYSFRGYRLGETDVSLMNDHLETVIKTSFLRMTWKEVRTEFDPEGQHSAKTIADLAWAEGWKGEEDIIDELMRPILFKEILLGREKLSPYNTEKLKIRYAKLWDLIYTGESSLSFERFEKLIGQRPPAFFYKVGYPEEFYFESDRGYIYKSALDDALHGMPILRISPQYM